MPDELEHDLDLLRQVEKISGGRIKPVNGRKGFGKILNGGESSMRGRITPGMICEFLRNEDVEPEMIGRMFARMVIEEEKKERARRAKHRSRMRENFRGCW